MRSANKTVYIQPNYSQNRTQYQQFSPQLSQPYILMESRMTSQRQSQKTEQPQQKYISPSAIKSINQEIFQIINMDPRTAENQLRKSAKSVYDLIDNELLRNIKHLSNMKLLLYNTILMYIEQFSKNQQEKTRERSRQKSQSISSSKQSINIKQPDIYLQMYNQSMSKELQNLKQTIPFIPKDKSKMQKNPKMQLLEEQLSNKIQTTKQSLENILKKIEHYSNYRLSGEDIMRLKRSVINVSELKPSHFLNLHTLSPTQQPNTSTNIQNLRPQSRQGKVSQQGKTLNRSDSRSKTYNGNFYSKDSCNISRVSKIQDTAQEQENNKLFIQQLEQIIEKKQNRIKELTKEMTKNLSDQKQLQKTIQNFQIQINEIQRERKNFQQIIQKLQQENLNYQLEIKELKEAQILRNEADKLSTSHRQDSSHYNMLKQFEMRQKLLKFGVYKQLSLIIQGSPFIDSGQKSKQRSQISSGANPFNDISQITPKRQAKKMFLPTDINDSSIFQSNITITRKNISPQLATKQSNPRQTSTSKSKYQIIGGSNNSKNSNKNKGETNFSQITQLKQHERDSYEKMLFLQALTIEQILQDL